MITPVCPCTRNSYKRFEGAREEDCRTIAGVAAVRAPPAWGSTTGTPGQAGSRPARTPAQKSHNSRPDHRIAPRFLLELPESISLIVAMESLHAPPLGGQGTPCGKGKVRKWRVGEQKTKKRRVGAGRGTGKKEGCNIRTSQKVTHLSTPLT